MVKKHILSTLAALVVLFAVLGAGACPPAMAASGWESSISWIPTSVMVPQLVPLKYLLRTSVSYNDSEVSATVPVDVFQLVQPFQGLQPGYYAVITPDDRREAEAGKGAQAIKEVYLRVEQLPGVVKAGDLYIIPWSDIKWDKCTYVVFSSPVPELFGFSPKYPRCVINEPGIVVAGFWEDLTKPATDVELWPVGDGSPGLFTEAAAAAMVQAAVCGQPLPEYIAAGYINR